MYSTGETPASSTYSNVSAPVGSAASTAFKETLHISPHIAAHKSSPQVTSTNSTVLNIGAVSVNSAGLPPFIAALDGVTYKIIAPTPSQSVASNICSQDIPLSYASGARSQSYSTPGSSVLRKDSSVNNSGLSNNGNVSRSSVAQTRAIPEDLSATSSEMKIIVDASVSAGTILPAHYVAASVAENGSPKSLPHIYTVAGQVPQAVLPAILDKNATFFRSDSGGINCQPQAILVSGLVPCTGEAALEQNANNSSLSNLSATSAADLVSMITEAPVKKEHENSRAAVSGQQQGVAVQQQVASQHCGGQRDLMRQALQAVVDSSGNTITATTVCPRQSEQELIEYNYSAGDIQDLLMLNFGPSGNSGLQSSSRSGSQTTLASFNVIDAVTGAQVIMMQPATLTSGLSAVSQQAPGHAANSSNAASGTPHVLVASSGQQQHIVALPNSVISAHSATDLTTVGPEGALINSSGNAALLQTISGVAASAVPHSLLGCSGSATVASEHGELTTDDGLANVMITKVASRRQGIDVLCDSLDGTLNRSSRKQRNCKLSETEQVQRRVRLAEMMRRKRANESDDQKSARRRREAERMRKRRACESEDQKIRRRWEAAERARYRRASLSPEQRVLDRRKAAERMRLRRLNESEEQKKVRRLRAAERMRRRRAEESDEQRAARRRSLAQRMKNRRRRKQEELSRGGTGRMTVTSGLADLADLRDVKPTTITGDTIVGVPDEVLADPLLSSDHFILMQHNSNSSSPRAPDSHLVTGSSRLTLGKGSRMSLSDDALAIEENVTAEAVVNSSDCTISKKELPDFISLGGDVSGKMHGIPAGEIVYNGDSRLKSVLRPSDKQAQMKPLALQKSCIETENVPQAHGGSGRTTDSRVNGLALIKETANNSSSSPVMTNSFPTRTTLPSCDVMVNSVGNTFYTNASTAPSGGQYTQLVAVDLAEAMHGGGTRLDIMAADPGRSVAVHTGLLSLPVDCSNVSDRSSVVTTSTSFQSMLNGAVRSTNLKAADIFTSNSSVNTSSSPTAVVVNASSANLLYSVPSSKDFRSSSNRGGIVVQSGSSFDRPELSSSSIIATNPSVNVSNSCVIVSCPSPAAADVVLSSRATPASSSMNNAVSHSTVLMTSGSMASASTSVISTGPNSKLTVSNCTVHRS